MHYDKDNVKISVGGIPVVGLGSWAFSTCCPYMVFKWDKENNQCAIQDGKDTTCFNMYNHTNCPIFKNILPDAP